MVNSYCCVRSCWKNRESKHRFPNPEKHALLFLEWIRVIGNKELQGMEPIKVYNSYRVCSLHFLPEDFGRNNRLKPGVVPSVKLIDAVPSRLLGYSDYDAESEESLPEGSRPKRARLEREKVAEGVGGNSALTLEGRELQTPLKTSRFREEQEEEEEDVISELPGCSDYVIKIEDSSEESSSDLEYEAITEVIGGHSVLPSDLLETFEHLNNKLNTLELKGWLVSRKPDVIDFYYEGDSDSRVIKLCVSVTNQLMVTIFYEGQKLNIGETTINSFCELRSCLRKALSVLGESNPSSVNMKISLIQDLLCSLRGDIPEQKALIDNVMKKVALLEMKSGCR